MQRSPEDGRGEDARESYSALSDSDSWITVTEQSRGSSSGADQEISDSEPIRPVPSFLSRFKPRQNQSGIHASEPQPFARLCRKCDLIFHSAFPEDWYEEWHELHANSALLQEAAMFGCNVCLQIWSRWCSIRRTDIGSVSFRYRVSSMEDGRIFLEGGYDDDLLDYVNLLLSLTMVPVTKDTEKVVIRSCLPTNTVTHRTWNLCRQWLYKCKTEHSSCGHHQDSQFRPTRLVHVFIANDQLNARLVVNESPAGMPYLTLSYCWGDHNFFTLKRENIEDLKQSIPIADLQQTFQDAFRTTLKLGHCYIWIDSLCIIQDSDEDWASQSSQMGKIYKYSACNLAATGFSNCRQSIFYTREITDMLCSRVSVQWIGDWPWPRKFPRHGEYYLVDTDTWELHVSRAPLNRRAWVLQERLLSPCTLHFGRQGVFWECSEVECSELFPSGIPPGFMIYETPKSILSYDDNPHGEDSMAHAQSSLGEGNEDVPPNDDKEYAHWKWLSTIEHYSLGRLTRSADKLVAISGAAKEVRNLVHDRYLAGLWKSNLLRGLLWTLYMEDDMDTLQLPFIYRAPSWSWASLDAEVFYLYAYDRGNEELHSTLIDANVQPLSDDDTGMVKGGFVRLKGPLLKAKPSNNWSAWMTIWLVKGNTINIDVVLDFHRPADYDDGQMICMKRKNDDVWEINFGRSFWEGYLMHQTFYFLLIRTDKDASKSRLEDYGIILSLTGSQNGEYIRIGGFAVRDETSRQLFREPAERLPRETYEHCDDSADMLLYTIKII